MNAHELATCLDPTQIIESLNDGLYAVDRDRQIVYWSPAAEEITGWSSADVVGRHCRDEILCHVDKDGHQLCGEEHCPLHRAMVTDQGSTTPIIVFAQSKTGERVPMKVSVAPVRNDEGEVIGGVETFRDLSDEITNIQRAETIQALTLDNELPEDDRISFASYYVPCDVIGGDYYAVTQLSPDVYGFMLADIVGHGVSAALYTMYLSSLWEAHQHLLAEPTAFCEALNENLCRLFKDSGPFAAAICGSIDLNTNVLRLIGGGNPSPLLISPSGEYRHIDCFGVPLGCMPGMPHDEQVTEMHPGESLLMFTDGAIEVSIGDRDYLGSDGLVKVLTELGYPSPDVSFTDIEEQLLKVSDRIRFDDDLTFFEIRIK